MSCPTFCLKTADETEATLALVNPAGQGNAIPTRSTFDDLDHRYNYSNGDIGKVPVRQQHNLTLSLDEVSKDIRDRLLDWKFRRVPITLCQESIGWPADDGTLLKITASNQPTGSPFLDDTERNMLDGSFSSQKFVWDDDEQELRSRASGVLLTEKTPFGDAWRFHGPKTNLGSPSIPEGITSGYNPGDAGYLLVLDGSVSIALATNFPFSSGLDNSLHFTSSTGGVSTIVVLSTQLTPAPAGDGNFLFYFFVKGSFGQKARLALLVDNVVDNSIDLSGKTFLNWTKIPITAYRADWTGLAPQVELRFNEATSDSVDFYIGPQFSSYIDGNTNSPLPHWCADDTAISPASGYVGTVDPMPAADEGTLTVEFVIPDTVDLSTRESYNLALADFGGGGGVGMMYLTRTAGGGITLVLLNSPVFVTTITDMRLLLPGRHIWTIAYNSNSGTLVFIADGKVINSLSVALSSWAGGSIAKLGATVQRVNSLFYFLSMRLDATALTTAEVIDGHMLIINDVLRGTIELAQGRYYEIVSVPQTPLIQEGNAIWLGNLVLQQIEYTPGGSVWYASDEGTT